jgi:hypothetical protein
MRLSRRFVRRTAVVGVATLTAGTLAIAALHHPSARPLLVHLGWACPAQQVGAAEVQAARDYGLERLRGEAPAPERPALGFELERSGEPAVLRWVERHRLRCTSRTRGLRSLECEDVPAAALGVPDSEGRVDSLTIAFDAEGRVVAVDALRRKLEARAAAESLRAAPTRLAQRLGPPTETLGAGDAADLGGGPFRTAFVRYRFRDYVATVAAVHLPDGGIAVREQYLAASTAG